MPLRLSCTDWMNQTLRLATYSENCYLWYSLYPLTNKTYYKLRC